MELLESQAAGPRAALPRLRSCLCIIYLTIFFKKILSFVLNNSCELLAWND